MQRADELSSGNRDAMREASDQCYSLPLFKTTPLCRGLTDRPTGTEFVSLEGRRIFFNSIALQVVSLEATEGQIEIVRLGAMTSAWAQSNIS